LIVYKKRMTTKQSYKKVPAISILIYTKWTKSSTILFWGCDAEDQGDEQQLLNIRIRLLIL